jgi:hypothetical protein
MFKIDVANKKLLSIAETTLAEHGIKERNDLEKMIIKSFDEFSSELGLSCLFIGNQVFVSDEVLDHLDILAVEASGAVVIVELKRSYDDNQLYQALAYAAMISDWQFEDFALELAQKQNVKLEAATIRLQSYLKNNLDALNHGQRVFLVAEEFDLKTLATAKWLREKHRVDVSCIQLESGVSGDIVLLSCSTLVPTPGLTDIARDTRTRQVSGGTTNWEERLAKVKNADVANFFKKELADGTERNSAFLCYSLGGRQRLFLGLRQKHAYVWQRGRFEGDIEFWQTKCGPQLEVETKDGATALAFTLSSTKSLASLRNVVDNELQQKNFSDKGADE